MASNITAQSQAQSRRTHIWAYIPGGVLLENACAGESAQNGYGAGSNRDFCMASKTTRIIQHPFASLIQGARLDSYREDGQNIELQVKGFQLISSKLFERDGKLTEKVRGKFIPLKLTFSNVSDLKRDDFFVSLKNYAEDDISRTIAYMYSWRQPKQRDIFHMFGLRLPVGADISFYAGGVEWKKQRSGKSFEIERDWSPAPPMPGRLVPQPKSLQRQFGGDPITIHLDGKSRHRHLFIGGLDIQPAKRPRVDAVLNLGERPSRWAKEGKPIHPNDRSVEHGEGSYGMTTTQLRDEANWVIERLQQNQRVLVHCVAGMNRSVTICCAVLILLEGLSADDALARVREHHPWARPDSHHWLALRWLAKTKKKK
jgi:hypothetical protein